MTRRIIERLPIFACAGFIGFLFLANLWNYAVERDWPKLRIRSSQPLNGVAALPPTSWTMNAFLSGETQRAVSMNLGRASPVFPMSVRVKNQTMYSLFGVSGASNIAIGRGGQLFGWEYINELCGRGAPPDGARIRGWAESVAEIADAAMAGGKGFAYLISPSKPVHLPHFLPVGLRCPALARGVARDKLTPYRAALEERGAPYVDGAGLMDLERANHPIDLFSRGGTHWNLLGAALALRETTRVFEASASGSPIGRFDFDWREDDFAKGTDRDLLDLLNLYWPDDHYPTAIIAGRGKGGACPRAPRLLMVGDSFMRQLIVVSAQSPCPPTIDYWFYMRDDRGGFILARFFTQPGEIGNGARLTADLADLPRSFLAADAIILEENEHNLGETNQVGNLLEAVRALK
ncbi:MAG: alginate O-acetyltransferase [Methylocystis sp.]